MYALAIWSIKLRTRQVFEVVNAHERVLLCRHSSKYSTWKRGELKAKTLRLGFSLTLTIIWSEPIANSQTNKQTK